MKNLNVKRLCLLFLFICMGQLQLQAQSRFVSPIGGVYGKDFVIINYVDWATDTFAKDHRCNTKTYDGHSGTDFVIRNFRAMDSGIDVRAADNGRVIFVKDNLFDREKISVVAKGFGNYIGISHSGKLQTYYAHLKKGSAIVNVGDSVVAGQKLAQVGSSGNCSDPHLHFELWYDSSYYIDPFKGSCGNPSTYWKSEPAFDTSYRVWTSGMCNYICTLDTVREEPQRRDTFSLKDAAITYWNIQLGLRKADSLRMEWYTPSGLLWFSYGYKLDRDWWYYYYWSYINVPASGEEGRWTVKVFRNNIQSATRPFYFYKKATALSSPQSGKAEWQILYQRTGILINNTEPGSTFRTYDVQGRLAQAQQCNSRSFYLKTNGLANGMYVLESIGAQSMPRRSILFVRD